MRFVVAGSFSILRRLRFALAKTTLMLSAFAFGAVSAASATTIDAELMRLKLSAPDAVVFDDADRDGARAFYAGRDYQLLWLEDGKLGQRAEKVLKALQQAAHWGLRSEDFQPTVLPQAIASGTIAAQATDIEIELSTLALRYARHAGGGRISEPSKQLSTYIDRMPQVQDPVDVLTRLSLSTDPDVELVGFHPKHDQFRKLQKLLLATYENAGLQRDLNVPLQGPELKKGDEHADVARLRKRLNATTAEGANPQLFDDALFATLRQFQRNRGLRADGVLGKGTRKALFTVPDTDRIPTILANMEQWRWMPADLGETHLFVNIPSFSVDLVKNGAVAHSERVIVGERDTQTPIFSEKMSTIVIRPEWYLPDSIKIKKIMSASNRGRSLESQGYKIRRNGRTIDSSRINWRKANLSNLAIYQPSGDDNALGNIKFLFPNKHSVYMHDTPMKSLFNAQERLFSHGCVRLRNPLALAQKLIDADRGNGLFDVTRLAKRGALNNEFALSSSVPVHIAYFTAWVGDDGEVRYLQDFYGHQKRITLALNAKWDKIERGRDHLAAVDTSSIRGLSFNGAPKRKAASAPRRRPARYIARLPAPMWLGKSYVQTKYRGPSYGNTVGDMIRRAFGN